MISFKKKLLQTIVLGGVLSALFLPITFPTIAQVAPIRGEVSPGVYENLKSDGAGHLLVGTSPSSGVSLTYNQSMLTVTSTSQVLWSANSLRKVLMIVNGDGTGDLIVGISPMLGTMTGIKLLHNGGSVTWNGNAPTNALIFSGTIASNPNVSITEGQ